MFRYKHYELNQEEVALIKDALSAYHDTMERCSRVMHSQGYDDMSITLKSIADGATILLGKHFI